MKTLMKQKLYEFAQGLIQKNLGVDIRNDPYPSKED
jgi:hypothetical protein